MVRVSASNGVLPPVADIPRCCNPDRREGTEQGGRSDGASGPPPDGAGMESAAAEREFIQAIEAYKRASGRMFPTWSEVLEVLRQLGYVKPDADELAD